MRPGGAFHWRDLAPEVGPAEPRAGSRAWDAGMAWALARRRATSCFSGLAARCCHAKPSVAKLVGCSLVTR